jgi:hypothetical protein
MPQLINGRIPTRFGMTRKESVLAYYRDLGREHALAGQNSLPRSHFDRTQKEQSKAYFDAYYAQLDCSR